MVTPRQAPPPCGRRTTRRPKSREGAGTEEKLDRVKGEVEEQVGRASGDENLENEGQLDQAKGELKEGMEKAKDAIDDLKGSPGLRRRRGTNETWRWRNSSGRQSDEREMTWQ
jgi:uncharacterized protein YjbJ (UPF0337 family)